MSKHWSDELKPIDPEEYKWQHNVTTDMLDELDEEKLKYAIRPVGADYVVMGFSEDYNGKIITGTIVVSDKEMKIGNVKATLGHKVAQLKKNIASYKKSLTT